MNFVCLFLLWVFVSSFFLLLFALSCFLMWGFMGGMRGAWQGDREVNGVGVHIVKFPESMKKLLKKKIKKEYCDKWRESRLFRNLGAYKMA